MDNVTWYEFFKTLAFYWLVTAAVIITGERLKKFYKENFLKGGD